MYFAAILPLLPSLCTSLPLFSRRAATRFDSSVATSPLTIEQALAAYPSTASCLNPPFGAQECDTAHIAVPLLNLAFKTYNITTLGATAALLSTTAFESVDFRANIAHSHNRTGQGSKSSLHPNT
jgi:hypothetical protein